ncbi:MAG: ComEC/Rec2 family competence protein [Azospirillaceae bacterium]
MADDTVEESGADDAREAGAVRRMARRLVASLVAGLSAERDRWSLWLPVAFGAGVALFFALPADPPVWAGPTALAHAAAGLALARRYGRAGPVFVALVALAAGFGAAQWRTARVDAPLLRGEVGPVTVEGRVVALDRRPDGVRITLDRLVLDRLAPEERPRRVRVKLTEGEVPPTGARVTVPAVLLGPSGPAAPGAFDFRRRAYFEGLGAVGYALGPTTIRAPPETGGPALWLERLRQGVAARIAAALDGQAGAVAVALLTGERGGIAPETAEAMRASGLAHLLAISGLHLGLIAGLVFAGLRAALAASETLALTRPIKKWAAAAALAAAFAYMLIVGATVPTQRAFLMTGIVLLGVLTDRTAISMRLVAWAAVVVLAIAPESLLGPSFQMSFAAVVALVAAYEVVAPRFAAWREAGGLAARPVLYLVGVSATTLIASVATGLFSLFHFQAFASYGIAANLLAVPVMAFWVMPWGVAAYALMPLGLEGLALTPMGWGLSAVLGIAHAVAGWPGAVLAVPAMPGWGLVAGVAGGLWLCLWQRPWRLIGMAGIAVALAGPALAPRPVVLIDAEARLVATRGAGGDLVFSDDRRAAFERGIWLERNGQTTPRFRPASGAAHGDGLACDGLACFYRPDGDEPGPLIALVEDPRAFAEDCLFADAVVATVPVPAFCRRRVPLVVDRFDVWRDGAHAVYAEDGALTVRSVGGRGGDRPWSVAR